MHRLATNVPITRNAQLGRIRPFIGSHNNVFHTPDGILDFLVNFDR